MNCYIHLDKPAVATCHECGMGLCRDCVDNSAYTIDNHPLCHDCNLKQASADLADAKSKKIWSLVKFIFGSSFLLLGISIYSSTGDIMNAWIYAGIAGIPAAFRSTRDSKREQVRKGVRDALTTDMMDSVSNTFIDLLVRIAAIIILAPITAAFAAIKNLFIFISSFGKVKNAQLAYDYLSSGQDIAEDVTPVGVSDSVVPQIAPTTTPDMPQQTILESGNLSSAGVPQSPVSYIPQGVSAAVMPKKTNTGLLVGIVLGVLLLAGGIMGYFLWYVPYAKDRDALRTYVLADNVFLRSSQMAGVEYNILEKIPYGSELITYNKNAEWSSVKVNGIEGYMASPYLLTQADFNMVYGVIRIPRCVLVRPNAGWPFLIFIRIISWRAVPQVGRFIQKSKGRSPIQCSILDFTIKAVSLLILFSLLRTMRRVSVWWYVTHLIMRQKLLYSVSSQQLLPKAT